MQKYGRNSHYSICARPDAFGLTLLVENPLSRDLVLRAKRVFVKYLDEDEQEARLSTYKDARKTGIGSTLAHSTNLRFAAWFSASRFVIQK